MPTLRSYSYFDVTIEGVKHDGGSRSAPQEITVSDDCLDVSKELAAGDAWDAWTASATVTPESAAFLWAESDIDGVYLEITVDHGADVGEELIALVMKAGCPIQIPSKAALANYTENFGGGTADAIDRIRFKNPSGATSNAKCRLFVAGEEV